MSRRERKKTALKKTFETVVGNCLCYFKLMGGKFLNFFSVGSQMKLIFVLI